MGKLKDIFLRVIPKHFHLPVWYYVKKLTGSLDIEIEYLKPRVPANKMMIDIGANIGIYSYAFASYCSQIAAFEPQTDCAIIIDLYKSKKITVYQVALSNTTGSALLYIPFNHGSLLTGLASLNPRESQGKQVCIHRKTLDSYSFSDVGFIKIDVEGHEMEVLEGATQTITRERPYILIEIEQRHTQYPILDVFKKIQKMGYNGGFLYNNELLPLEQFSYEIYQKPFIDEIKAERYSKVKGKYICNFIFKP